MSDGPATRAAQLRAAFDRSFAQAPEARETSAADLLLIVVGGDAYAIRLLEIGGIFADRPIRRLPGPMHSLIGMVGLRGSILPVHDLRILLGYPAPTPPRLVMLAAGAPVALACDRVDGHRRVAPSALAPAERAPESSPHVRDVARLAEGVRPVIDVPSVTEAIVTRAGQIPPSKERDR